MVRDDGINLDKILSLRMPHWIKEQLRAEAVNRMENLSRYVFTLIEKGWESLRKEEGSDNDAD